MANVTVLKKRRMIMKETHKAFNTHLILNIVLFAVFLGLSISCAIEIEIGMTILFGIFVLFPVFVFVVSPLYYIFTNEEIVIVYTLGQREVIKWNSVRNISLFGSWIGNGVPRYVISYPVKEKRPFFVMGEISKTRKTTKLIEKYWKISTSG